VFLLVLIKLFLKLLNHLILPFQNFKISQRMNNFVYFRPFEVFVRNSGLPTFFFLTSPVATLWVLRYSLSRSALAREFHLITVQNSREKLRMRHHVVRGLVYKRSVQIQRSRKILPIKNIPKKYQILGV